MERNTVERVTEWDSEPFNDGYAGLHEFADRDFTGAVTDGAGWLFMLNGRVVGVFDGDLSQFSDADGTAYVAPDQSLPLLFAMQETGGEVRGEYYTEETPISEVDRTLQSGNFTGYVELSENVLSGDYYLVYYGGRRLPVAFVGNQERRLTGDEAFERAADEVGIYRVKTVDLEITDVPEPPGAGLTTAATTESATEEDATTPEEPAGSTPDETPKTATDTGTTTEPPTTDDTEDRTTEAESETEPERESDEATPAEAAKAAKTTETEATDSVAPERTPSESSTTSSRTQARTEPEPSSTSEETTAEPTPATDAAASRRSEFEAESEWQGTSTIPALDPDESVSMESETPPAETTADAGASTATDAGASATSAGVPPEEVEALRDERDRLQERVESLEEETERLGGERDRLERERDEAASAADQLENEVEELRSTVDELEAELEAAEADLAAAEEYMPEGDHEISPEEAMQGTSLFVRYEREGGPTLEDAYNGDADREAVNENVRLERHTEFEDAGALVDGQPFDEYLRDTIEYGFVNWLTRTFVHDIRETRNQTALGKLFDAIPDIDRIEFRGSVDLGEAAEDDDEEAPTESAAFDVVLRDRMGQPLIVTDLNDSREPATEPMLESLIRNATPVGEANERLSAAFYVTSSYYEPGALETAEEATGGGILSRGKNKSFVRLSRKDGYHLSLVETRDGEFHVSVPEL
jgi:hypothetical protein